MYLKSNMNALYVGRSDDAYIFTIVDPETNTFDDEVMLVDVGRASNWSEAAARHLEHR